MNEEIDEADFYHQDFTTASEWEIFIAQIEEIINQWKIDEQKAEENPNLNDIWKIKSENLNFVDFHFIISLYKRKPKFVESPDSSDGDNKKHPLDNYYDFILFDPKDQAEHSSISDWYGFNEYIVLSPAGNVGIISESKIKVLLSSIYIVSANLKCEIPLFIQIREKWQKCYLGVYECEGIRTNLEMIHLRYGPRLCQYLSGLLELFRSKIVANMMTKNIGVSLQLTHILTDFGNYIWKQQYMTSDDDNLENLYELPFGITIDPIHSLILKSTWSCLSHRAVRDCESYTYFNPLDAQKWSLLIKTTTDQPICLLGESLTEFVHLLNNRTGVQEMLSDIISASSADVNNPLDVLTEPRVPTISSFLSKAARNSISKSRKGVAPLSEDVMVAILYYLFPDADEESRHTYKDVLNQSEGSNKYININHECRGFKTCNPDSLIWRLAIVLCHCLQSLGGYRAFAYLWYEFVQEMRYRWEKNISIPGLLPGYPDLRTALLHQKLQMVNCCIDRKLNSDNANLQFNSAENSSDEEFFDCEEEEQKRSKKYSLWNQPAGRLGVFNNLKLIATGDDLYIPLTQEMVPKSEDQIEEDTDFLLKLGSDAQGSELRAKMMSASLLSDMESFKAANPGSILEDFIRWYSPRDWIEDEELDDWGQKRGHLSPRMMIEDNFWVKTWQLAKPVPAHRQKRLFDDTREAEKVLHFLESRDLSQICELLLPVLCHASIYKLADELKMVALELPEGADRLRGLVKNVERISRDTKLQNKRIESVIQEVIGLELKISEANSLMYKFNPAGSINENISHIIKELVIGREVEIVDRNDSEIGQRIIAMFSEAQKSASMISNISQSESGGGEDANKGNVGNLPQANEKEIVLRVNVNRPATYSTECPQFMRAILGKNEFRLVGGFSEDIMFF